MIKDFVTAHIATKIHGSCYTDIRLYWYFQISIQMTGNTKFDALLGMDCARIYGRSIRPDLIFQTSTNFSAPLRGLVDSSTSAAKPGPWEDIRHSWYFFFIVDDMHFRSLPKEWVIGKFNRMFI